MDFTPNNPRILRGRVIDLPDPPAPKAARPKRTSEERLTLARTQQAAARDRLRLAELAVAAVQKLERAVERDALRARLRRQPVQLTDAGVAVAPARSIGQELHFVKEAPTMQEVARAAVATVQPEADATQAAEPDAAAAEVPQPCAAPEAGDETRALADRLSPADEAILDAIPDKLRLGRHPYDWDAILLKLAERLNPGEEARLEHILSHSRAGHLGTWKTKSAEERVAVVRRALQAAAMRN